MTKPRTALVIGGLDPTNGAGIGADARVLDAAGVWPCSVASVLTAQSTRGVRSVHPVSAVVLRAQLDTLVADVRVHAVKVGALGSAGNQRVVSAWLAARSLPVVIDPVVAASRGGRLSAAGKALRRLLAHATIITPNAAEAGLLLGGSVDTPAAAREAARALLELGPLAVMLKGGHLPGRQVVDYLATSGGVTRMARRRIPGATQLHGTGCALASLLCARLAGRRSRAKLGHDELVEMAGWASGRLRRMMRAPRRIGSGMAVMEVG